MTKFDTLKKSQSPHDAAPQVCNLKEIANFNHPTWKRLGSHNQNQYGAIGVLYKNNNLFNLSFLWRSGKCFFLKLNDDIVGINNIF